MRLGFVVVAALLCVSCSNPAIADADAYARGFSIPTLQSGTDPELRIWTEEYVGGGVLGYVIRPGEITIHEAYPGLGLRTGDDVGRVVNRPVETPTADAILQLIPKLRRVRFGRCDTAVDGGGVIVEGIDHDGRFAFSQQNHHLCEGWNLHVLNEALELSYSATHREG